MPEGLVYEIAALAMDNHARMMTNHTAARETPPENVGKNTVIPFHPGAVRWFEENIHDVSTVEQTRAFESNGLNPFGWQ